MRSVLSVTEHDYYAFPLPIVVWSWHKLGIKSIVLSPKYWGPKLQLARNWCNGMADFYYFDCEERKEATFAQTSRLFGATVVDDDNKILITGDSDLAVFGSEFEYFRDGAVRVIGADLLSPEMNQYPMCFIGMPVKKWKDIFGLHNKTLQDSLDETVGQLESVSFRGDFWGYDQWYAHKKIKESGETVYVNPRAKMPERFAIGRLDRDDAFLLERDVSNAIDFHLPRPGHQHIETIITIFQKIYPNENIEWMRAYANAYKQLI